MEAAAAEGSVSNLNTAKRTSALPEPLTCTQCASTPFPTPHPPKSSFEMMMTKTIYLYMGGHSDRCDVCNQRGILHACDSCSRAFHASCVYLNPEFDGFWFCIDCRINETYLHVTTPSPVMDLKTVRPILEEYMRTVGAHCDPFVQMQADFALHGPTPLSPHRPPSAYTLPFNGRYKRMRQMNESTEDCDLSEVDYSMDDLDSPYASSEPSFPMSCSYPPGPQPKDKCRAGGKLFTSRFRGVYFRSGKYNAQIQYRGKKVYLGSYAAEVSAAIVYDIAAQRYHGSRAILNFNYPLNFPTAPSPESAFLATLFADDPDSAPVHSECAPCGGMTCLSSSSCCISDPESFAGFASRSSTMTRRSSLPMSLSCPSILQSIPSSARRTLQLPPPPPSSPLEMKKQPEAQSPSSRPNSTSTSTSTSTTSTTSTTSMTTTTSMMTMTMTTMTTPLPSSPPRRCSPGILRTTEPPESAPDSEVKTETTPSPPRVPFPSVCAGERDPFVAYPEFPPRPPSLMRRSMPDPEEEEKRGMSLNSMIPLEEADEELPEEMHQHARRTSYPSLEEEMLLPSSPPPLPTPSEEERKERDVRSTETTPRRIPLPLLSLLDPLDPYSDEFGFSMEPDFSLRCLELYPSPEEEESSSSTGLTSSDAEMPSLDDLDLDFSSLLHYGRSDPFLTHPKLGY